MPYHGEERFQIASWVRQRLQALHPDFMLLVATDGGSPWTKARAVNRGMPEQTDVVVVVDADVAVPANALEWAVSVVAAGAAWAVPYSIVHRLHQDATAALLHGTPALEVDTPPTRDCIRHRPPYPAVPGGGIFVVARDAWGTAGGFDERFVWGVEDASLGYALDTLAGPHLQHDGPLVHLWHTPRVITRAIHDDHRLEARYRAARGDVEAMRRLIRERTTGDPTVHVKSVPHASGTPV